MTKKDIVPLKIVKNSGHKLKHFTYKYKKATNFRRMYLLSIIHKRLFNVPGRPVI